MGEPEEVGWFVGVEVGSCWTFVGEEVWFIREKAGSDPLGMTKPLEVVPGMSDVLADRPGMSEPLKVSGMSEVLAGSI